MARTAADAVRSARLQGGNFSASTAPRAAGITVENCPPPRISPVGSTWLDVYPSCSMLKNFYDTRGLPLCPYLLEQIVLTLKRSKLFVQ
jgi:hypothetical protein